MMSLRVPTLVLGASRYVAFHTSSLCAIYEKRRPPNDSEELSILNKSNLPPKSTDSLSLVEVSEAAEIKKPRPPKAFFSTSIFYDPVVDKFVNCMMYGGKKAVSRSVLEDTFERIKKIQLEKKIKSKEEIEIDPLKIFHDAIENAKPVLGTQTMKKKGKSFQVPYPLPPNRRQFLAIKWLITTARSQPGNDVPMSKKLSKQILDAYKNEGTVIQKRIDFHKKAESNRALAHYRWW